MFIARLLLALLLVSMAAGQLSDIDGFVDIVATYQVGGNLPAGVFAVGLMLGELIAGAGLVVHRRPARLRHAASAAVAVAVAWSGLAAQAFVRGLVLPNCGCFGVHLAQPLRWWVLLEDAEFLAVALWVRHRVMRQAALAAIER